MKEETLEMLAQGAWEECDVAKKQTTPRIQKFWKDAWKAGAREMQERIEFARVLMEDDECRALVERTNRTSFSPTS